MTARLTDGRLEASPSPLLTQHVIEVELRDELDHADLFVLVDLAHTVMCTRQGIFDPRQGAQIASALLTLLAGGTAALLSPDPQIGSITLQIERYLERRCGPAGLDIQRARSRIDQNATGLRMADREGLLDVLVAQVDLAGALLDAAERHEGLLIPGYTHLQHAQPTTLDHYFNAHYWAAARSANRLLQTFDRMNECPLGGAAHSGTSWPIDRRLTAGYLGFTRPVPNARDAGMSAFDGGAELAAVLGLLLAAASRCASDLYFWSSSEVNLVRIHPSLCGTSSMMPQKRNPIALERIRGLAGEAAGWAASQLGVLHFASSTDSDQAYVSNRVPAYCQETVGALELLAAVVRTLDVDAEAMSRSAGGNWSTASARADALVAERGLSYRAAHDHVARWVTQQEQQSRTGVTDPDAAASPDHPSDDEGALLDARAFVDTRTSEGATSPESRAKLSELAREDHARLARAAERRSRRVHSARARLVRDAEELARVHHHVDSAEHSERM